MKQLIFGVISLVTACLCLSACSEDEIIADKNYGYFRTPGTNYLPYQAENEGEEFELTLYSKQGEEVIPIKYMGLQIFPTSVADTQLSEGPVFRGELFLPRLQFTADGYDSYPNTLDYTYTFNGVTCSTFKDPASATGKIRVKVSPNTTGDFRRVIVYLQNQDSAYLEITQAPIGFKPE